MPKILDKKPNQHKRAPLPLPPLKLGGDRKYKKGQYATIGEGVVSRNGNCSTNDNMRIQELDDQGIHMSSLPPESQIALEDRAAIEY